jgi:site-specific recombinase XerD
MHGAAYIEQQPGSSQTSKQHLAAIKMLFDYLVIRKIVPTNPAWPVTRRSLPAVNSQISRGSARFPTGKTSFFGSPAGSR